MLPPIDSPPVKVPAPALSTLNLLAPPTCKSRRRLPDPLAMLAIFNFMAVGEPVVFQEPDRSTIDCVFAPVSEYPVATRGGVFGFPDCNWSVREIHKSRGRFAADAPTSYVLSAAKEIFPASDSPPASVPAPVLSTLNLLAPPT